MSNRGDMEYYLEAISVFYDEKLKFLSTKDNFLRCKRCPKDKKIKEEYDEVSLSCGGKDSEKDCGMKINIKFPVYLHYERDMELLKKELQDNIIFNYETINNHIDVSDKLADLTKKKKLIEEKMNDITDKFHKINVQNKKKDVENFYKSRVEKTKRCREILKSIDKFEETEKKILRSEYISLVKKLNEEYIEVKEIVDTFQPYHMVKKPDVSLFMKVESGKQKIIKKKKKPQVEEKEKEETVKYEKGDIVYWSSKGEILSGSIKTTKEVGGMLKVIDENQKLYYVPKGKLSKGEYEPEPQLEEEEETKKEEKPEKPPKQEKMYYFSRSKDNKWLSTFNVGNPFKYNGIEYPTVEHAFHAQKVADEDPMVETYRIALSTNVDDVLKPNEAKKFGSKASFKVNDFTLRDDWNSVRLKIMEEIEREYYMNNRELIDKLIETGEKLLIHKGFGIDDYWGVKGGDDKGENNHGKILMKLREEFKNA